MKIALVHDYLAEYGGAERVVEAMHEIWPDAPLYTAFVDWKRLGTHADRFRDWEIRPSWVQDYPFVMKYISPLRFLAPKVWESFDFSAFDVVLISSGWFIPRGVIVKKPRVKICYIHHPPRNLYGYATGSDLQKYWPVRLYANCINFFLRHYDYITAQTVDYFIANSKETAKRVEKFYRRNSTVIYPPIQTMDRKENKREKGTYYLSVGRLSFAKRVDAIIEACNALHVPLIVVGIGHEEKKLRALAGPSITFAGSVSDEKLQSLYAGAKALVFAAIDEDFGMVPVEAMAAGTPVIALRQGGVKETILEGKTGIFFENPESEDIQKAIQKFVSFHGSFAKDCKVQAKRFAKEVFKKQLQSFVEKRVVIRA